MEQNKKPQILHCSSSEQVCLLHFQILLLEVFVAYLYVFLALNLVQNH